MDVQLKVLAGKNAGQEIPVGGKKFYIGRSEDCHLRPGSDLVSRHHCAIIVEDGYTAIRDFGSKNGTFVNDEPVHGERELKSGDHVKVGPLDFEIVLTSGLPTKKRPPVADLKEAASRAADMQTKSAFDPSAWLDEPASAETSVGPTRALQETQHGRTGDTDRMPEPVEPVEGEAEGAGEKSSGHSVPPPKRPAKFKAAGPATKDSREAAAKALNMLRKRR